MKARWGKMGKSQARLLGARSYPAPLDEKEIKNRLNVTERGCPRVFDLAATKMLIPQVDGIPCRGNEAIVKLKTLPVARTKC